MVILLGILLFGLLILVHEWGHFITAKQFDIKIHAFAIGMGPAIWKKQKGEVEYSLRALPIGGYVKLEGEDGESEDPRAFGKKPPLARIAVLLAGAAMNILVGFIIFVILFSMLTEISVPVIDKVMADTPAAASGLMPGDKIVRINGSTVHIQNDVSLSLMKSAGETMQVVIKRAGETKEIQLTPQKLDDGRFVIGFLPKGEKMTPGLVVKTAFYNTFFVVKLVYYSLGEMISGHVQLQDMSGPVGIVNEMSTMAKSSMPIENMLNLMGLIAVNLGVMNLLPLPALDGGRIFFILVELIRRKPIRPEHEGLVHAIGFVLLLALMAVVTFSDITKLFA
ncbi:MAG: RIP metalloprotease RseP [Clostridia bacterium]|nr:RIP metalloprotease RseP [Clostridia bacterium]